MPEVGTRSFTATGTPCSGPSRYPCVIAAYASLAAAIAGSAATVMKALSVGWLRSMRASAAPTTSTGETCRLRIIAANSAAEAKARSGKAAVPSRSVVDQINQMIPDRRRCHTGKAGCEKTLPSIQNRRPRESGGPRRALA